MYNFTAANGLENCEITLSCQNHFEVKCMEQIDFGKLPVLLMIQLKIITRRVF